MMPKYCRYKCGVEAGLLGQQPPDERAEQQEPEPEDRHEARAEEDDREQRRNVVDLGEQKSEPPLLAAAYANLPCKSNTAGACYAAPGLRAEDSAAESARAKSSRSSSVRKLANTSRLPCEASESWDERPMRDSSESLTQ